MYDLYHNPDQFLFLILKLLILKKGIMGVLKVIEILGNSKVSFEDAIKNVVNEAAKSVKGIKSVYVKDMQVCVKDNKITEYRVNAKVTFGIQG